MSKTTIVRARPAPVPVLVGELGVAGRRRFAQFFTAELANDNTRLAYARAVRRLCDWCEVRGVGLLEIEPVLAAAYLEDAKTSLSLPTLKQHLSAIRRLFDWWVTGGVLPLNPFSSVRLPRYSQRSGKTPVLFEEETRRLFDAIETDTVLGLRDRALLGCMTYAFLRVSAVVGLRVKDYESSRRRSTLAVLEKGGKWQRLPCHHQLAEDLDAYVEAAGIGAEGSGPLFRGARGRGGQLTDKRISRSGVLSVVKKRAEAAGLPATLSSHSFRATGITNYLAHGGDLETAAAIAGHASTQTTQLYNRNAERITQAELERIRF